ncbi:hypothetical protein GCM10010413_10220 [Promicromonospora sukumoe]|uniref:Ligand-binding protein with streptavidin-like fold n=1 Tax=Promicromonospora sukumoe TaxID=88382 RepID=A0A7W3PCA2_9MICO|nr:Atu4866 domain-containing protein [Promicromonospora sukumoe]MBA8806685.1 hypothetical protein [Promicromonospora sukumoe]
MTTPSGAALIAVGVALAALLAACGGTPGPTPDPTDREDGPMTAHPKEQLVITGATVLETPGTPVRRDLHVADGVLAAGSPDDEATAVPAEGMYAVPLLVDSAVAQRPASERDTYDLVPGNAATFALVRRPVSESQVRGMLVVDPADLAAAYVSGHAEALDGEPTRPAGADLADAAARETWVGTWEDPSRGLEQHLGADGRYAETRNGRANAYTGRFWVREGRITYLDDSGFWAFGELLDGTLHHAGFVMHRQ